MLVGIEHGRDTKITRQTGSALCKMQTVMFLSLLLLTVKIQADENGVFFKVEENHCLSDKNVLWSGKTDSLLACSQTCARQAACKSANFIDKHGSCSLLGKAKSSLEGKLLQRDGSFYVEKIFSSEISSSLGISQSSAVPSCQTLLNQSPPPSSGIYWIDPDGGSHTNAFQAYCDMETDGGGWTLVWSYTFTDYNHFERESNAITPRPNWQILFDADVPVSTTPPFSETDYNAMNFSLWKQLGRQVLIKSNINNWLVCYPGTGSLVDWQRGEVSCQIAKNITDMCKDSPAPSSFQFGAYGPEFSKSSWASLYYYFDGNTKYHWPVHDPCGEHKPNHLENVAYPHGNIFIRT